jgi:hypothetical protein
MGLPELNEFLDEDFEKYGIHFGRLYDILLLSEVQLEIPEDAYRVWSEYHNLYLGDVMLFLTGYEEECFLKLPGLFLQHSVCGYVYSIISNRVSENPCLVRYCGCSCSCRYCYKWLPIYFNPEHTNMDVIKYSNLSDNNEGPGGILTMVKSLLCGSKCESAYIKTLETRYEKYELRSNTICNLLSHVFVWYSYDYLLSFLIRQKLDFRVLNYLRNFNLDKELYELYLEFNGDGKLGIGYRLFNISYLVRDISSFEYEVKIVNMRKVICSIMRNRARNLELLSWSVILDRDKNLLYLRDKVFGDYNLSMKIMSYL